MSILTDILGQSGEFRCYSGDSKCYYGFGGDATRIKCCEGQGLEFSSQYFILFIIDVDQWFGDISKWWVFWCIDDSGQHGDFYEWCPTGWYCRPRQ